MAGNTLLPTQSRAVAAKINGEVVLVLGWARAILLQLAHPLVAAGVADHSSFDACPRKRVRRLRETIQAMLTLTFGTAEEVERTVRTINAIHDRVNGKLKEPAGHLGSATPYSAHDPALLSWVHITLLDSMVLSYEFYVGPLTRAEKDQYCAEACAIEQWLGMPAGTLPKTFTELQEQLAERLSSREIEVTETARRVASQVTSPDTILLARPVVWLLRLPAVGLLPPDLRMAYGFRWTLLHRLTLRMSAWLSRLLLPWVSPAFRYWPQGSRFWFGLLERTERVLTG